MIGGRWEDIRRLAAGNGRLGGAELPNRKRCRSGVFQGDRRGAEHPSPALRLYRGYAGLATLAWLKPAPVERLTRLSGHRPGTALAGQSRASSSSSCSPASRRAKATGDPVTSRAMAAFYPARDRVPPCSACRRGLLPDAPRYGIRGDCTRRATIASARRPFPHAIQSIRDTVRDQA